MGIKAGGAIRGVRVLVSEDSCPACRALAETTYIPDNAPVLPLASRTHAGGCCCAYTPVMQSEVGFSPPDAQPQRPRSDGAAPEEI